METNKSIAECKLLIGSYRTYEEWKQQKRENIAQRIERFLPYLWGMETIEVETDWYSYKVGSYRTYEEWKL